MALEEANALARKMYPWPVDAEYMEAVEQVARELAVGTALPASYFYPKAKSILGLPCLQLVRGKK